MSLNSPTKTVLTLAGHDPSGGAGIQADIETIGTHGCHPATIITCLTIQDSRNVSRLIPIDPALFLEQAEALLDDLTFDAVKIGLLGSREIAEAVARVLDRLPGVPVVLDPVLAAGGGTPLAQQEVIDAIRQLLPRTTLITPNRQEARQLSNRDNQEEAAAVLLEMGCGAVLITGADERANPEELDKVENRLFTPDGDARYRWQRLPFHYHGSGCTLASACAARLALGDDIATAVEKAQRYTWVSLQQGYRIGKGQHFPNRLRT